MQEFAYHLFLWVGHTKIGIVGITKGTGAAQDRHTIVNNSRAVAIINALVFFRIVFNSFSPFLE